MTAEDIRRAIRQKYNDHRQYAIAEEVGLTTGYSHRRLDMMVMDCYNSNGFRIDGFEIKVSASDLRRELEDPEKHVAFFDVIDYYTLAVPHGLTDKLMDVIPPKWGILFVNEDGSTRYKRRALALRDEKAMNPVPRGFLASITRSIQAAQPAAQELRAEYERGYKEANEKRDRDDRYQKERIKSEFNKIKCYEDMMYRFHIWSDDPKKAMDEFEAFRSMDLEGLRLIVNSTKEHLDKLGNCLVFSKKEGEGV